MLTITLFARDSCPPGFRSHSAQLRVLLSVSSSTQLETSQGGQGHAGAGFERRCSDAEKLASVHQITQRATGRSATRGRGKTGTLLRRQGIASPLLLLVAHVKGGITPLSD